jgi:hypothetical protein
MPFDPDGDQEPEVAAYDAPSAFDPYNPSGDSPESVHREQTESRQNRRRKALRNHQTKSPFRSSTLAGPRSSRGCCT